MLFFKFFISDRTSSLLIGVINKEFPFGFLRYLDYWCIGFISFSPICLAIELKCLLNSFVISDELVTVFFPNLNTVDTIWSLCRYVYDFVNPLLCFKYIQFIIMEIFVEVVSFAFSDQFKCSVFIIPNFICKFLFTERPFYATHHYTTLACF